MKFGRTVAMRIVVPDRTLPSRLRVDLGVRRDLVNGGYSRGHLLSRVLTYFEEELDKAPCLGQFGLYEGLLKGAKLGQVANVDVVRHAVNVPEGMTSDELLCYSLAAYMDTAVDDRGLREMSDEELLDVQRAIGSEFSKAIVIGAILFSIGITSVDRLSSVYAVEIYGYHDRYRRGHLPAVVVRNMQMARQPTKLVDNDPLGVFNID